MASNEITVAFAGSASVDLENVKALLNDFLGYGDEDERGVPKRTKRDVRVLLPLPDGVLPESLDVVVDWIDYADAPYVVVTNDDSNRKARGLIRNALDVEAVENVSAGMVDALEASEGEKFLVLLWDEENRGELEEAALDLAMSYRIPCLDLAAGLDEIGFEDDDVPEEEEQADEVEAELPAPVPVADKVEVNSELEFIKNAETYSVRETLLLVQGYLAAQDRMIAIGTLKQDYRSPIRDVVAAALVKLDQEGVQEAAGEPETDDPAPEVEEDVSPRKRGRGRPRKGEEPEPEPVAYVRDAEGNYRKRGRGRLKAGEEVVMLTPDEVADLELDS